MFHRPSSIPIILLITNGRHTISVTMRHSVPFANAALFANILEATEQMAVGNSTGSFGAEFGMDLMNFLHQIQVAFSVEEDLLTMNEVCEILANRGLVACDDRNVVGNVIGKSETKLFVNYVAS